MKRALFLLLTLILALSPCASMAQSAIAELAERYAQAELQLINGDYSEAAALFENLGTYADSSQMAMYCKGLMAAEELALYDMAAQAFQGLGDFRDSKQLATYYQARGYEAAGDSLGLSPDNESALQKAVAAYQEAEKLYAALSLFKDSMTRNNDCKNKESVLAAELASRSDEKYQQALALEQAGKYKEAIKIYQTLGADQKSQDRIAECTFQIANELSKKGDYGEAIHEYRAAITLFSQNSKDNQARVNTCKAEISKLVNICMKKISAGGYHTVGLRKNGTVLAIGWNQYKECSTANWKNVTAVAAGGHHTVALRKNGTVAAIGLNTSKQRNTAKWKNITAIAVGWSHTVGLRKNGTVVATGNNFNKQCNTGSWKNITAIAAGWDHTVGLRKNGTVVTAGNNYFKQRSTGNWKNIAAIAAGHFHTVGLRKNGTVVATGKNLSGQCNTGKWTGIVAVAAGEGHTVGLKYDGTVVAVGSNQHGQCDVSGWTDIIAIAAGGWNTIGLKSNGTVVATGKNDYGQCNAEKWNLLK